jgi:hypothetical protein
MRRDVALASSLRLLKQAARDGLSASNGTTPPMPRRELVIVAPCKSPRACRPSRSKLSSPAPTPAIAGHAGVPVQRTAPSGYARTPVRRRSRSRTWRTSIPATEWAPRSCSDSDSSGGLHPPRGARREPYLHAPLALRRQERDGLGELGPGTASPGVGSNAVRSHCAFLDAPQGRPRARSSALRASRKF